MGCVTFVSTQHNSFIKRIKWVGLGQPTLLTGRIRVEGSWHNYEMGWVRVEPFNRIPLPRHNTVTRIDTPRCWFVEQPISLSVVSLVCLFLQRLKIVLSYQNINKWISAYFTSIITYYFIVHGQQQEK